SAWTFSPSSKTWYRSSFGLQSPARIRPTPSSRSRLTRCPPMNPPAPVTRTCCMTVSAPPPRGRRGTAPDGTGDHTLETVSDDLGGEGGLSVGPGLPARPLPQGGVDPELLGPDEEPLPAPR